MSFDTCLLSERLTNKLPVAELRELAKKYTRAGVSPDAAMLQVLRDKLELARMEERTIIKAVRSAWEAKGGAARQPKAAPAIDPAPTAKPELAPGQDVAPLPDLNEMFAELLAEEAAAKPASDDLNAMFAELLAEESGVDPRPTVADAVAPKPKKARATRAKKTTTERSAGQAAASAAKNIAGGTVDVLDALGELFGGKSTFGSGPVFNEQTYAKAKPLFKEAIKKYSKAGQDLREVMRTILKAMLDKFGYETTANMQPYIVRYVEEYRTGQLEEGENNAADRTAGSAAGDQRHRADGQPPAERDIFDVGTGADVQARAADGQPGEAGGAAVDRSGVSGRDAATGGAQGDQRLRAPESGPDGRAAESGDTAGSGNRGSGRARPGQAPDAPAADAAAGRDEKDSKLEQQRQAAAVPVKLGDRANIDATLPYLMDGQRDDVAFAEKRFATEGKMPGVLFTNGTGTGKTGTGAGIIARQIRAGKTEGLILVPNNGIARDWIEFGSRLGITINLLGSTSENGGKGAAITTFANFGANPTLADRNYDWVLADEAHYLMASKDGDMTDALAKFRALTRHPGGFHAFSRMKNRALFDKLATITNKESAEAKALFDRIRKAEEKQKEAYAAVAGTPSKRPKAIFLSATPFAYVKSVDYAEGYLFEYPADGKIGNSNQDGRAKFFVQHFGYRIRYHKLTEPDGNVDVGLMARQFNNWLKAEGALSGRTLEVDADYGRRFIQVESALGAKIDEGMEFMREHPEYKHLYQPFMKEFSYLRRRYLLEAIKAKEALPVIQQHLDLGRKVVVVHDYKKGGAFNPFHMTGINGTTTAYDDSMNGTSIDLAELAEKFKAERPDLVRLQFPGTSALATLRSAHPSALVHNGDIPEKQLEANKRLFNDDASGRNLIILQSDKGREGISLHDTTGAHQRVTVNIGMPAKPTAFTQLEGRTYRNGQVSDAVFDYIVTGTMWERWTFAQTIAERADIAEALAMGDDARALKDAIVEAFEDAQHHDITAEDGKGGKARDRQAAKMLTDWDRAKTFYYGQLKRNSSTKALEGKDYFATPEPLGFKMVEWADIRPGEDVLEPSAGHGAIARWFPVLSNKTINEMETELVTRARLAVNGQAKFLQGRFEDVNIVNKFDAIVMNPPFGVGGSLAIPHLRKAYQHLRDGGRIVALLPRGPAADGKLEKFLYGDDAPKDLYMVADIELPRVTFERAGTNVGTHVVILDKISDPAKAPHQVARDYTSAEDIEEFFDRIQHSTVPGRVKTDEPIEIAIEEQKKAPKKQPRQAAEGAEGAERYYAQFEFKHTKTGEQLYGAAMLNRTSMETYKEANGIAKQHGGWYNKFVGGGALRGFLFKSAEDRAAFMSEAGQLGEVSAGLDAQNSLTGDLGIDSQLIDHMETIADERGMVQAQQLLAWVRQQDAPGAAPLANWLEVMGDATVAQSSVVKFMENSGNAMFSNMPGFYSALAQTIPAMAKVAGKDGTVLADQARLWLAARQKEGKFKADELEWSGVLDWLKARGDRVAVADIVRFVEENGVQVQEVWKGAVGVAKPLAEMDEAELRAYAVEREGEAYMDGFDFNDEGQRLALIEDLSFGQEIGAGGKYAEYVLPGGKNYRELLLTLPEKKAKPIGSFNDWHQAKYGSKWGWPIPEDQKAEYRRLSEEYQRDAAKGFQSMAARNYTSSHWDEKNILAHVRFNDRTDADGKRVLFIEELQSDWGQDGKKYGFEGQRTMPDTTGWTATKDYASTQGGFSGAVWRVNKADGSPASNGVFAVTEAEAIATVAEKFAGSEGSVLAGPFVTDTKAWLSLGLKRMIQYAVEHGYDRVAFVNGAQSADRYDLSKQIDSVQWKALPGGAPLGMLTAKKDGRQVIKQQMGPEQLEDHIGKEVAKKLLEAKPTMRDGMEVRKLEGLDLQVGGEGMKTFYDKIVPQTINDVLKKLGGGKAGTVPLVVDSRLSRGMDYEGPILTLDALTDFLWKNRSDLSASEGQQLNAVRNAMNGGESFKAAMEEYASPAAAEALGGALVEREAQPQPQVGFDITDQLRTRVQEGMPLFSRAVDQGRRQLLALAAAAAMGDAQAGDVKLGKARAINAAVLDQRVTKQVERILRRDTMGDTQLESGATNLHGAAALRDAMKAISLTGPKELRALAAQVAKLLPADGVMLTVDDTRRMNVHGVVELSPMVHMRLFTAEGRTGLSYGTLIHEALHVAVAARYRSLSVGMVRGNDKLLGLSAPAAAQALEQFEAVWEEFRQATRGEKFTNRDLELAVTEARGNPDEFFVRALTDPILQGYLAGKRYEGKTLWARFKDWVKSSLFGLREEGTAPSWLDAALAASEDVAAAMTGDRADFARMGAIRRHQAASRARENSMQSSRPWERPAQLEWERGTDSSMAAYLPDGSTLYITADEDGVVLNHFDEEGGELRPEQPYADIDAAKAAAQELYNQLFASDFGPDTMERRALPTPAWVAPTDTRLDKMRHALQDKHIDMKRTVQAVRDAIGDLGDKWDPYLQEELYHGRSATGFKQFLQDELRPLLTDMQARGVSMDELQTFLHMRHAEEANKRLADINEGNPDGLAGVGTQEALDYLANLGPAQRAKLEALASRVDAIIKGTQRTLVAYGLEKQETIDAWNATYQHYVPLHREDMDAAQLGNGTGAGYSVRGSASRERTGSRRAVVDILANIAMAREKAIVRGEKNRIAMSLYGMALQAPNPGFWKPVNPQKNRAALEAELVNMGLSPAEAAAVIDEPKKRRINKQTGMVESYVSLAMRNAPHVVAVRVGGEDRFLFFNERNERAMRMAASLKNVGEDTLDGFMGVVGWATRQLAAMNTQYNPIFGAVNLVRDVGEGSINLSSTPIAGKQADVLAEAGQLLGKVIKGRGRMSNLTGTDAALWAEFQQEGGITGYRSLFARSEDRMKELRRELGRMSAGPGMRAGRAVMDWLSDYNEALENVTRLAAYKVAKGEGLSNQQAASLAKNLTVNFNRKGAKTRIIGALYAFFNAAAQGTTRMLETLTGPAGKRIVAGGILLGVLQAVMLAMAGFEDEDIPEFVRAKNLVIPASLFDGAKDYVTVPLPLGFSFLPSIGRIGTEFALGGGKHPGRYGARLLTVMLDTFNPLDSSTPLQMLSPTVADPVAALAENKDFTGRSIALEDHNTLKPTPGHTRAKETASAVGKGLSWFFNAATGGTDYSPGGISWTPDQIDYFIGQLTGGVGRELLKAQQTLGALVTGEEVSWNKVPLAGRFYSDAGDKSALSTKFYENMRQIAEHGAEVDGRRQDKLDTKQYRAENPEAKLAGKADAVMREISELRRSRRQALEKGDKVRVKEAELRIRTRMEKFNAEVEAARSKAQ